MEVSIRAPKCCRGRRDSNTEEKRSETNKALPITSMRSNMSRFVDLPSFLCSLPSSRTLPEVPTSIHWWLPKRARGTYVGDQVLLESLFWSPQWPSQEDPCNTRALADSA